MFHKEESNGFLAGEAAGSVMRPAALPACEWLTADEAAAYLKLKTRALLRLGNLRAYMLSGTRRHVWRFLKEDL